MWTGIALSLCGAAFLITAAADWRSGRTLMTGRLLPHYATRAESPLAFRLWVGFKAATGLLSVLLGAALLAGL